MPEGAIYVGRPTVWGNPFKVGEMIERGSDLWPYITRVRHPLADWRDVVAVEPRSAEHAVQLYGWWFIEQPALMLRFGELAGRDLACWCALDQPCHADLLLELANPS